MRRFAEILDSARPFSGVPDSELDITGQIRRRMLRGEQFALTGPGADAALSPGSRANWQVVQSNLRRVGFVFETAEDSYTSESGRVVKFTRYRLTNPTHRPTEEQIARLYERTPRPPKPVPVVPVEPEGVRFCELCEVSIGEGNWHRHERTKKHQRALAMSSTSSTSTLAPLPTSTGETIATVLNGEYVALEAPVPTFGSAMQVFALIMDDDGSIKVGVRSGEGKWIAKVEGFVR